MIFQFRLYWSQIESGPFGRNLFGTLSGRAIECKLLQLRIYLIRVNSTNSLKTDLRASRQSNPRRTVTFFNIIANENCKTQAFWTVKS